MSDTTVNLAELIGSRICHDLISPIGAITNGLELLEMVGALGSAPGFSGSAYPLTMLARWRNVIVRSLAMRSFPP